MSSCTERYAALLWLAALASCLPDGVDGAPDGGSTFDAATADSGARDAGTADGGVAPVVRDEWWRGAVAYEVFVRSFQDSDGDGIGDLPGLISRLDYFNDLGVDAIWLMPIHPSPSYHGYDVTDYLGVNPEYGTLADFETLVTEAHARDLRVVIDFVINHSSRSHPWFVSARNNVDSEFRDYYLWRDTDPGWIPPLGLGPDIWHPVGNVFYYGVFGSGLPDLNHTNDAVYAQVRAALETWLDRGVDGFRFDAVRYLVENEQGQVADLDETHAVLRRLKADLVRAHPDALFLGEAWSSTPKVAEYYGDGDELDLAFNFDLSQGLQEAAATRNTQRLVGALRDAERNFDDRFFEAPFITNHDMNRLIRDARVDERAFRLAAATLFAMPGTPFIYYGEEIGMKGGGLEIDEDKRTPFRWTAEPPTFGFSTGSPWRSRAEADGVDVATQRADSDSLWRLFQRLILLRKTDVLARQDVFERVDATPEGVVAVTWGEAGDQLLYAANFAASARQLRVAGDASPQLLVSTASVTADRDGSDTVVMLPPQSFGYVRLR